MVPAREPLPGELLITQLYTTGAASAGGTDHYYSDQFIEIVNTAADFDLSGLRVANVFGSAGEINWNDPVTGKSCPRRSLVGLAYPQDARSSRRGGRGHRA